MINFLRSLLFPKPPSIYASKYWTDIFAKYREEYAEYKECARKDSKWR